MEQDAQQIKQLSIFHYVVGGIAAIFACFPIFHLVIGIGMLTGTVFGEPFPTDEPFPLSLVGLMFTILPAAMILIGWAYAVAMLIAGKSLAKYQNFNFCLVMAALSCAFTPFGTALGVFTIIVLSRPAVKELFNQPGAAAKL